MRMKIIIYCNNGEEYDKISQAIRNLGYPISETTKINTLKRPKLNPPLPTPRDQLLNLITKTPQPITQIKLLALKNTYGHTYQDISIEFSIMIEEGLITCTKEKVGKSKWPSTLVSLTPE